MTKNSYLCSDMKDKYNYSFPRAKSIVVSGDIHGDFTQLVFKCCVQYEMTDTLIIVEAAGETEFDYIADLGYRFRYVYDIIGKPSNVGKVADYARAATAARILRSARAGMAGYRDMNLYGTLYI